MSVDVAHLPTLIHEAVSKLRDRTHAAVHQAETVAKQELVDGLMELAMLVHQMPGEVDVSKNPLGTYVEELKAEVERLTALVSTDAVAEFVAVKARAEADRATALEAMQDTAAQADHDIKVLENRIQAQNMVLDELRAENAALKSAPPTVVVSDPGHQNTITPAPVAEANPAGT